MMMIIYYLLSRRFIKENNIAAIFLLGFKCHDEQVVNDKYTHYRCSATQNFKQ